MTLSTTPSRMATRPGRPPTIATRSSTSTSGGRDRLEEAKHLVATEDRAQRGLAHAAAVGDEQDVGREHVDERLEVAGVRPRPGTARARGVLGAVDALARAPGGHVLAGPVGDLAHRCRGAVDALGDLGVGHVEHLAQHEHRPLDRGEGLQHQEHRGRHAVGELDVVGDVGDGERAARAATGRRRSRGWRRDRAEAG